MTRKTAWMLAIWLLLTAASAGVSWADVPAALRQAVLAPLADETGREARQRAKVVVSGGLAAVSLPRDAGSGSGVVYLLERDAGDAERWHPVTRIAASAEDHFGDAMILGTDTVLVAAPDTAGAGLGPGMAYVFQRNVGGTGRWGLVARLEPAPYPPPGAVEVRQLALPTGAADAGPRAVAGAPPPPPRETAVGEVVMVAAEEEPEEPSVAAAGTEPPEPAVAIEDHRPEAAETELPEAADVAPAVEEPVAELSVTEVDSEPVELSEGPVSDSIHAEPPEPAEDHPAVAEAEPPEPAEDLPAATEAEPLEPTAASRFIVVANMSERPRALNIAASLRAKGYPSEVYRNYRGYFVVTLAHLPVEEARVVRAEAVAAGDIPQDSYLIVGSGLRDRISP